MTTARITHRQEQADPTPRRDLIGFLLLTGIEWTDAHPAFGFIGAAVSGLIFAVIKWRWL